MKNYVDANGGGAALATADSHIATNRTSIEGEMATNQSLVWNNLTAVNTSMKSYVDSKPVINTTYDTIANQSTYVIAVNNSMKAYVDANGPSAALATADLHIATNRTAIEGEMVINQSLVWSNMTAMNASMKAYVDANSGAAALGTADLHISSNMSIVNSWISTNASSDRAFTDLHLATNRTTIETEMAANQSAVWNNGTLVNINNGSYVTINNGSYVKINNGSYVTITNTSYFRGTRGVATSVLNNGSVTHGLGTTPTGCIITGTNVSQNKAVIVLNATVFQVAIRQSNTTTSPAAAAETLYWECWK
jgi:hypothetical protein